MAMLLDLWLRPACFLIVMCLMSGLHLDFALWFVASSPCLDVNTRGKTVLPLSFWGWLYRPWSSYDRVRNRVMLSALCLFLVLQALDTRYFRSHPLCPENIPDLGPLVLPECGGSYHEFQTKRKRKEDGILQQDARRAQRKKVRDRHMKCESVLTVRVLLQSPCAKSVTCRTLSSQDKRGFTYSGEGSGPKGDPRRAGERVSPPSPQRSSVGAIHRSSQLDNGSSVSTHHSYAGQPVSSLPRPGVTENWAPPLPPPNLLDAPPPPRSAPGTSTAHGLSSQQAGAPQLPPRTSSQDQVGGGGQSYSGSAGSLGNPNASHHAQVGSEYNSLHLVCQACTYFVLGLSHMFRSSKMREVTTTGVLIASACNGVTHRRRARYRTSLASSVAISCRDTKSRSIALVEQFLHGLGMGPQQGLRTALDHFRRPISGRQESMKAREFCAIFFEFQEPMYQVV